MAKKPQPCPHPPSHYRVQEVGWYCNTCDRDISDEVGNKGLETSGSFAIHGTDDPDEIPEGCLYRHQNRRGTGPDEERREAAYVQKLRDHHLPTSKSPNGRIRMSIPVELYWGKIRQTKDKNYWNDPRNTRRHKNWMVKE